MHPCLESHGVVVSEIVEKQQMEYNLGGNTILWFSMVLLNKISENKQDLRRTFIMSAVEVFVMKKMEQWKENLVTSLEIPRDLAMKETVFTVTGKHQAVVCNYRSVLRYEKEEIILLTFRGNFEYREKD